MDIKKTQAPVLGQRGESKAAEAEELVRRGKAMLLLFDPKGYEEAVPLFRAAIEAAPALAPAYAGLSETYSYWGFRRQIGGQESQSLYDMAHDYAHLALRLAPELAEAHRAMAVALRHGRRTSDHERRRREIEIALELDPRDALAWAESWRANGYHLEDAALARALELAPDLCGLRIDLGAVYCELERYDEAAAELMRALKINPRNSLACYDLSMVLDRKGDRPKAIQVLREAREFHREDPLIESGLEFLKKQEA